MRCLSFAILLILTPSVALAQAPDAGVDAGDASTDASAHPSDAGAEALIPPVVEISDKPLDLVVGVAGSAPFVVRAGEDYEGISVEIWEELAKRRITYEYRHYPDVLTLVNAVARNEVDVGVGPISITSDRAARVGFTQPHFSGELAIAARPAEPGVLGWAEKLVNRGFLTVVIGFFVLLVLAGALLWLAERKHNPEHFPKAPLAGIANGVWVALVTLTTVGYGDRVPKTPRGRAIAGVWMLLALVGTSSLTAFLATTLTLAGLEEASVDSIEDLEGARVAVPRGTAAVQFVRRHGGHHVLADDIEDALAMAADGSVAAAVFDRAVLAYHLSRSPELDLVLSERSYDPVGYGFAVSMGSELEEHIDIELLELRETPRMETIRVHWLGE